MMTETSSSPPTQRCNSLRPMDTLFRTGCAMAVGLRFP
jgi:hypothetical protein